MEARERTRWVMAEARELGFEPAGIAPADDFPELARLEDWLARGHAGEMRYLHDRRRRSPGRVLEGARSVIVGALNYNTAPAYSTEAAQPGSANAPGDKPRGWISRYAWGDDYHDVLGGRLRALLEKMRARFGRNFQARHYVDTGPIVERIAAKYAGLGWLGKNTCLIHPRLGSWLFLGVIVTTLELEPTLGPGEAPPADLCGRCRLCLDACPTGALVEPYLLDARRCISYLTIELRGPIPEEFRPQMGGMVFGCDICQDVCPWNRSPRRAPLTALQAFAPRQPSDGASLFAPELEWLAGMDEAEFRRVFRRSAVKRAKWRGLVRNACIALGNSAAQLGTHARERAGALLARLAASPDPLIAEHARWALARLAERDH
jgi:epoxyqueuosine reductase